MKSRTQSSLADHEPKLLQWPAHKKKEASLRIDSKTEILGGVREREREYSERVDISFGAESHEESYWFSPALWFLHGADEGGRE